MSTAIQFFISLCSCKPETQVSCFQNFCKNLLTDTRCSVEQKIEARAEALHEGTPMQHCGDEGLSTKSTEAQFRML